MKIPVGNILRDEDICHYMAIVKNRVDVVETLFEYTKNGVYKATKANIQNIHVLLGSYIERVVWITDVHITTMN